MSEVVLISRTELDVIVEQIVTKTVAALESKPPLSVMTKAQLAKYVNKPISTIDRWMKQGLPYRKEGNEYPEFYKPHVDKWLERRFGDVGISDVSREKDNVERQELV